MSDHLRFDTGGGPRPPLLRRLFPEPGNPLTWSLPIYRAWGIRVRIHLLFLVYIAVKLIGAASGPNFTLVALILATLFLLVLLHEYGHCFACRWVGGSADDILLWPLGGLAFCRPPRRWKADLITTLGGPAVNVVLFPILALALYALTRSWGAVFFNPFTPSKGWVLVASHGLPGQILFAAHYTNALLLAFNMLVPMYPMDAGRTLHAILWRTLGHRRGLHITVHVGIGAACVLGVIGIAANETLLLALAILGGLTCFFERRQLMLAPAYSTDLDDFEPVQPSPRLIARERQHTIEVERILDKIAREGMGSLSRRERKTLEHETRRRRNG